MREGGGWGLTEQRVGNGYPPGDFVASAVVRRHTRPGRLWSLVIAQRRQSRPPH